MMGEDQTTNKGIGKFMAYEGYMDAIMMSRAEGECVQTVDTEEEDAIRKALRRSTNKIQGEEEIKKVMKYIGR